MNLLENSLCLCISESDQYGWYRGGLLTFQTPFGWSLLCLARASAECYACSGTKWSPSAGKIQALGYRWYWWLSSFARWFTVALGLRHLWTASYLHYRLVYILHWFTFELDHFLIMRHHGGHFDSLIFLSFRLWYLILVVAMLALSLIARLMCPGGAANLWMAT